MTRALACHHFTFVPSMPPTLCSFHPESWNPVWSVASILAGLQSFMVESSQTVGSIETSVAEKLRLAAASMEYNKTNKDFCRLFPELVERYEAAKKAAAEAAAAGVGAAGAHAGADAGHGGAGSAGAGDAGAAAPAPPLAFYLSLLVLLLAVLIAMYVNR